MSTRAAKIPEEDDAKQVGLAINHQVAVIKEAIAAIKTTHGRIGGPQILKKYMGDAVATAELLEVQLRNSLRLVEAGDGRFK